MSERCPWCGAPNQVHAGVDPSDQPITGDCSVCYGCRRLGVFVVDEGGHLSIRKPTEQEATTMGADPRIKAALAALRGPLGVDSAIAAWRTSRRRL